MKGRRRGAHWRPWAPDQSSWRRLEGDGQGYGWSGYADLFFGVWVLDLGLLSLSKADGTKDAVMAGGAGAERHEVWWWG